MKLAITGATGLIGGALARACEASGDTVLRLVRERAGLETGRVQWDPETGVAELDRLENVDAVVHLAGENLASGRWTAERKARFRHSRVHGTRVLAESLARLVRPPRAFLSASAIGIYGDRGPEVLTEDSAAGRGFLAQLCQDWEGATAPASSRGMRVVLLRFGVVLSPVGGALARMLPAFRLGLGGPLGDGRQFWSWIALADVVEATRHLLKNETLAGPVNLTAPEPIAQRDFARVLGRALRRPAVLPAPAWALKLALGEMAEEALLASARVVPAKLKASGYRFRFPQLAEAVNSALLSREI